jgi:hypothetical protein
VCVCVLVRVSVCEYTHNCICAISIHYTLHVTLQIVMELWSPKQEHSSDDGTNILEGSTAKSVVRVLYNGKPMEMDW